MNIEKISLNKYVYREKQDMQFKEIDLNILNASSNEKVEIPAIDTITKEDAQYKNTVGAENDYNHITVKHIVIGGGGTLGFIVYGFLRESYGNLWHHSKLKSLYGTSVGSIVSTLIALNIEWSILDAYLINRPWHQVFQFDFKHIIYSVNNCGIFDINTFKQIFDPLLTFKELDVNITLKEFFEWNHIDIHYYLTEIYAEDGSYFKKIDVSHTTHPDWKLIDAVYASSAVPVAFSPLHRDGCTYIDGGILNTFPINDCIHNIQLTENTKNEICAFQLSSLDNIATNSKEKKEIIKNSLIDLLIFIIIYIIFEFTSQTSIIKLKYDFKLKSSNVNGFDIHLASSDAMIRRKLVNEGSYIWHSYVSENKE